MSKAEESKRDLERCRGNAVQAGKLFAVRHSVDSRNLDPPSFRGTIAEAEAEADRIFVRLDTAQGADVHARPSDMQKVEVWIERFSQREWTNVPGSNRRGYRDAQG